jgi:NAD-dependent deacetylase
MSSLSHYLEDPEVRQLAWQNRVRSPAWGAQPNDGHRALVKLEERGVLVALVTQNIDELHQQAGHHPNNVVEVHGTMRYSRCWSCSDRRPMQETLQRVRDGEIDPACLLCSGILKSDTISFGQSLVPEVIERAMKASENCDVLLAVGSSLSVFPAANVVPRAKAAGARVIIINGEPTKMDQYADVLLVGKIGDVLPAVIG